MAKFEMESWEELMAAEIASFEEIEEGDITTEDLLLLEDGGNPGEEVHCCGDAEHDRWELDPASAEDFLERNKGWRYPAMRWRHFGH